MSYIDVENMDSQESEDIAEVGAYREISTCFGIPIVRLGYKPEEMELIRYTLDDEQEKAYLFYEYNGEMVKYSVYMNDTDSSFGQKELDKLSQEYEIDNGNIKINVEEFSINNSKNKRYIAEFEYRDIHYQLKGVMIRSEFDEILKKLIFI